MALREGGKEGRKEGGRGRINDSDEVNERRREGGREGGREGLPSRRLRRNSSTGRPVTMEAMRRSTSVLKPYCHLEPGREGGVVCGSAPHRKMAGREGGREGGKEGEGVEGVRTRLACQGQLGHAIDLGGWDGCAGQDRLEIRLDRLGIRQDRLGIR